MKKLTQIFAIAVVAFALFASAAFAEQIKELVIKSNPHCANCKTKIEAGLQKLDGIKTASVDVSKKTVTVSYDADKVQDNQIRQSISDLGFKADRIKAKSAECKDDASACKDKKGNKNKNCCKTKEG
ncbi:MAG: heavy metal-associated domain-containing protein [Candidatus Kapabacteria bacterium]|nr:heavy metal-associated domain-containing protein [Candidatus Kapabacteria bacterium]